MVVAVFTGCYGFVTIVGPTLLLRPGSRLRQLTAKAIIAIEIQRLRQSATFTFS
jgi:hypothetical protein